MTGDIYSGANIDNLKVDAKSVVVSGGVITSVDGTDWKIQNYNPATNLRWQAVKNKMTKNKTRLLAASYKEYIGNSINGQVFNLNPDNVPEGQVWRVNHNLEFSSVTFSGKGTFIIEGTLNITGDISYVDESAQNKDSLGIIANTININNTVDNLTGAYYSFGEIKIQ